MKRKETPPDCREAGYNFWINESDKVALPFLEKELCSSINTSKFIFPNFCASCVSSMSIHAHSFATYSGGTNARGWPETNLA